jgi:hypothetical protein
MHTLPYVYNTETNRYATGLILSLCIAASSNIHTIWGHHFLYNHNRWALLVRRFVTQRHSSACSSAAYRSWVRLLAEELRWQPSLTAVAVT